MITRAQLKHRRLGGHQLENIKLNLVHWKHKRPGMMFRENQLDTVVILRQVLVARHIGPLMCVRLVGYLSHRWQRCSTYPLNSRYKPPRKVPNTKPSFTSSDSSEKGVESGSRSFHVPCPSSQDTPSRRINKSVPRVGLLVSNRTNCNGPQSLIVKTLFRLAQMVPCREN